MYSWDFEWKKALRNLEQAIDIPVYAASCGELVYHLYEDEINPRAYHNSEHILSGCALLDEYEIESGSELMPQTRYAWMCHDAKNDPRAKDNEECSAFLACSIVANVLPHDPIMSTKIGFEGNTIAGRIIKDVDYSYFGKPYEEFVHITSIIRQEYSFLTDDEFNEGRKKFLSSLDPEKVFWTPFFKKRYDKQAKENLEKALA